MIPERIAKEIEEMCSRISEPHRQKCKEALEASWEKGGLGIYLRVEESNIRYSDHWIKRTTSDASLLLPQLAQTCWLASVEVVSEGTRSVVQDSEIK